MQTTPRAPATRVGAARRKLLAAAAERFYADGVSGTGIDAITAAAGVAKMSLYNNFASKDDLVLAYLEARHEEWLGLYRTRLDEAGPAATPRTGVEAVFDEAEAAGVTPEEAAQRVAEQRIEAVAGLARFRLPAR